MKRIGQSDGPSRLRPLPVKRATAGFYWAVHGPWVSALFLLLFLFLKIGDCQAEEPQVSVKLPKADGWTGERIPILVELAILGSFAGAPSFDVPEVPGSLLIKVGNPVVSSRDINNETWFVQTHEFNLFSQSTGQVTVPAFPVRFARRSGFTSPIEELVVEVPAVQVNIKSPPGPKTQSFVVTTTHLRVEERWSPQPGDVQVGDTLKRTITQQAESVPGMALATASQNAPNGVRVYVRPAELKDRTERGVFIGERSDEITYLIQQPGRHELPALAYHWWNPELERLESVLLPAMVLSIPAGEERGNEDGSAPDWQTWVWPVLIGALALLLTGLRRPVQRWTRRFPFALSTPQDVAYRQLIQACQNNEPGAAYAAVYRLRFLEDCEVWSSAEMRIALAELEQRLFGATPPAAWNGSRLRLALRASRKRPARRSVSEAQRLPPLNPGLNRPKAY
jgi:hypothetical protein